VHGLGTLVSSDGFRGTILFLIVANAFAMGLEAIPEAAAQYGAALDWVFLVSQVIFVVEILARWWVADRRFFEDSWNRFDFVVVALSLTPAIGEFALIARVFRVLRVLRIVSVGDVLFASVLRQDAGVRAIVLAMCLLLLSGYVFALTGFHLFGTARAEWSSLAHSVVSLLRGLTPDGLTTALSGGAPLLIFHCVFLLALLAIVVNLAVSLSRQRRGAV